MTIAALLAIAAAMRIVSISPATTADLFAIGAGPDVVAIDRYATRPASALHLPRVGTSGDADAENVLAFAPSLVTYEEPLTPQMQSLVQAGVHVVPVPCTSLADDYTAIEKLGVETGRRAAAGRVVASIRARIERGTIRAARRRRLRVLVLLWPDPISSAARGSFLDDLLRLANLENVAQGGGQPFPLLSPEAVAVADPDVILTGSDFTLPANEMPWKLLRAVRERRVVALPHELFDCGPDMAELFDDMVRAVAPFR